MVALQVSRLSRDDDYFNSLPTATPAQSDRQDGLQAIDHLLFEHRLNQTEQSHLLKRAETSITERLEQALLMFAERPALSVRNQTLSYRELHAHSIAIQRLLLPLLASAKADTPPVIGICLPKSPELYAGILAILGCGAVYLPLDPGQPLQRQQYILENSGAMLLLHDGSHPLAAAEFPALDIAAVPMGNPVSARYARSCRAERALHGAVHVRHHRAAERRTAQPAQPQPFHCLVRRVCEPARAEPGACSFLR
ncbi:hypothetical protein GSU75_00017 [Pseudomonas savastanoi pv. phaseolicola]|nr:hypothetical protein [Pseudomonas savastanoi pv. phaseolicola]